MAYHPGRERTEVARQLIMHMTSERTKRKFPTLEATWERAIAPGLGVVVLAVRS